MERDSRRDRGQWRGCYTFKDIVCEGGAGTIPRRTGGLKMGHTYYYYYELDGASETHDPTLPSTNTCPYLPGQTVNTLWIPVEQSLRKRSASLTSLREEDYKTMDPASKFAAPRPAPTPPETTPRIGTAPLRYQHQKRPSRSLSPGSVWSFSPRKLFSRKSSSSSLKETKVLPAQDERSGHFQGSRSRDMSPESLRKFLVDARPLAEEPEANERPVIVIPDDIVEENEDDDNFATSAVSETVAFTGLAPPPQRTISPSPTVVSCRDGALSVIESNLPVPAPRTRSPNLATKLQIAQKTDRPSYVPVLTSPNQQTPESPDAHSPPGFYLSEDEEDEGVLSGNEDELPPVQGITDTIDGKGINPFARNLNAALSTYSLPRTSGTEGKEGKRSAASRRFSVCGGGPETEDVTIGNPTASLLSSPGAESRLEDLVDELGWMANMIRV